MTVYAADNARSLQAPPALTKTFNVMVWVEMDRVRVDQCFYKLSISGAQSGQPEALLYAIDGKPATMQQTADLLAWAKREGSVELVAEEVAA